MSIHVREVELYHPIKLFFESIGYVVKSEVNHIDVVCMKDEDYVAVELKTTLNITVIAQALKRQSILDSVYIVVPKPSKKVLASKTMKDKLMILKRTSLGLLFVDMNTLDVEVLIEPLINPLKRHKKRLIRLKQEFNQRQLSINIGGMSKQKIMTLYKEHALVILNALKDEPKSAKTIQKAVSFDGVYPILYKNYYGWFDRLGKGMYGITDLGKEALNQYHQEIITLIHSCDIL